jgi:hypothetical protein
MGDLKSAIKYYTRAINLKPDSNDKFHSIFIKPYEKVISFKLKDFKNIRGEF